MTAQPCPICKGQGYILHVYDRGPGDPQGNVRIPCDCTHADPAPDNPEIPGSPHVSDNAQQGAREGEYECWYCKDALIEKDQQLAAKHAEIGRLKAAANAWSKAWDRVVTEKTEANTLITQMLDALREAHPYLPVHRKALQTTVRSAIAAAETMMGEKK